MTLTTLNGSMYSGHRVSLCRVLGRLTASADQQPFLLSLLTGRAWQGLALQSGAQSER